MEKVGYRAYDMRSKTTIRPLCSLKRVAIVAIVVLVLTSTLMPLHLALSTKVGGISGDGEKKVSGSGGQSSAIRAVKKWTIMVYMDADNDLEDIGVDDFNEMENVGSNADMNIVVQFDRIAGGTDSSNGDWTTTRRYYVLKDDTYDPFSANPDRTIRSQLIEDIGEVDMGSPQTLRDFLQWAVGNYTAEHYLLVLWDHGSGIFRRGLEGGGDGGGTRGVCLDSTSGRELKLWEVGDVLRDIKAAYNVTFDIVGFDVCSLGAVETAYELMDVADYMIASADEEPDWGWDYTSALSEIEADPNISPRELGVKATIHFLAQYSENYVTQATVDLEAFRTLYLPALNEMADALNYYMYDYRFVIKNIRNQSHTYTSERVDIGDFAVRLSTEDSLPQPIRDKASSFLDVINDTVIERGCGASHLGHFYGMFIYFPKSYYRETYTNYISFSSQRWDEFLRRFINPTPVGVVIDHTPLRDTEDTQNPYYVVAEVRGDARDDSNVSVVYTKDGINFTSVAMDHIGGDTFRGIIPPQANNTDVYYYIRAIDIFGNESIYPLGASEDNLATLLHFHVGTDFLPPTIQHTPLGDTMDTEGPYVVTAMVSDNIGVEPSSVVLEWYAEMGLLRNETNVSLNRVVMNPVDIDSYGDGTYRSEIPAQDMGTAVYYRITANDTSTRKNTVTVPSSDYFTFKVLSPYGQILVDYYHDTNLETYNNTSDYIEPEKYVTDPLLNYINTYTLRPYDVLVVIRPGLDASAEEVNSIKTFVRDGGNLILIPGPNLHAANSFLNFTTMYLAQVAGSYNTEVVHVAINDTANGTEGTLEGVEGMLIYDESDPQRKDAYFSFNYDYTPKTCLFGTGFRPLVYDSSGAQVIIGYAEMGYGHGKVLVMPDGFINWPYVTMLNNELFAKNVLKWILYNLDPVSVINITSGLGGEGDNITMDGFDSSDPDGYIVNYTWFVDDKAIYYGPELTLNLTHGGDHKVTLVVKDNDGASATVTEIIHINQQPKINLDVSVDNGGTTLTLTEIEFDASNSFDPDGDDMTFQWDMGDGTEIVGEDVVIHSYQKPGIYYITLNLTDTFGKSDSKTWMIIVEARPPKPEFNFTVYSGRSEESGECEVVADSNGFYDIYEDYLIVLDATATTDPDNTFEELNLTWDFGDGTYAYGPTARHYYTKFGNYQVSLVVTDIYGKASPPKSVRFSVINPAPLVDIRYSIEGNAITIEITKLDDTESDRNNLSIWWDMGDGTIIHNKTKVTHKYNNVGVYTITLNVTDDEGGRNVTTLNISMSGGEPLFGANTPYVQAILIAILIVLVSSMVWDRYKASLEGKDEDRVQSKAPPKSSNRGQIKGTKDGRVSGTPSHRGKASHRRKKPPEHGLKW